MSSFEFLASQKEWEDNCYADPYRYIDVLPQDFRVSKTDGGKAWTFPALLLATLVRKDPYCDYKVVARAGLAGKNGDRGISGFPGILDGVSFCSEGSDEKRWSDFSAPSPAVLDALPKGSVLLRVDFNFKTPFFSKDDMPFYPTDNVLKRHKVFDAPYLSASGIKGLLRWVDCMVRENVQDDEIAQTLFGKIGDKPGDSAQGALYCYPVFLAGNPGLEVINPQDRATGAGTVPVKYEVLKPQDAEQGSFFFLLASLPDRPKVGFAHVQRLLKDLSFLFEHGGLSAKSSAGWGRVNVLRANAAMRRSPLQSDSPTVEEVKKKMAETAWAEVVDEAGNLRPLDSATFTTNRIKALTGCTNREVKDREARYADIQSLFEKRMASRKSAFSSDNAAPESAFWIWPEGTGFSIEELEKKLRSRIDQ